MRQFERPLSAYEQAYKSIEQIIRAAEREFMFGGDEDENGDLDYGAVDFVAVRKSFEEAAANLTEATKTEVILQFDVLSNAGDSLSREMFTDCLARLKQLLLNSEENIAMQEDISRTLKEEHIVTLENLSKFVDSKILSSEFGSSERSAWGNALNNYRDGDKTQLIALLKSEYQTPQDADKPTIEGFLAVL